MVTTARVSTEETCTNVVDFCLTDLLREQVRSHSDRLAVVSREARLTYRELAHEEFRSSRSISVRPRANWRMVAHSVTHS